MSGAVHVVSYTTNGCNYTTTISLLRYINLADGRLPRCKNRHLNNQGLERIVADEWSTKPSEIFIYSFWIFDHIKFRYISTSFYIYRVTQCVSHTQRKLSLGCNRVVVG